MKKWIVLLAIAVLVLFALFSITFLYSQKEEPAVSSTGTDEKKAENTAVNSLKENNANNSSNDKTINMSQKNNTAAGASNGGSVGSSSSVSKSAGNPSSESSCMIIRPGNLPGISCSVNSITINAVSIKLKNELGEKIDVELQLDTCSKTNGSIENLQEKDFVFTCLNNDYFNQAIHLSYILGQGKVVDVGGFVAGKVI